MRLQAVFVDNSENEVKQAYTNTFLCLCTQARPPGTVVHIYLFLFGSGILSVSMKLEGKFHFCVLSFSSCFAGVACTWSHFCSAFARFAQVHRVTDAKLVLPV